MITSRQNAKVKQWLKLHQPKGRRRSGTFLVEGFHLVEEAYRSGWTIEEIIVQEGLAVPSWCESFAPVTVSSNVMQHITQTVSPQGIAAVVQIQRPKGKARKLALLLDAIQDPGNLGTMIRTADALAFDMIFVGEESVDVYNDKVVRATQGSLFHVPIVRVNLKECIPELQAKGFVVWASALARAIPLEKAATSEQTALIIGNEGSGIRDAVYDLADKAVSIPIHGRAESLNASVAAGILMYSLRN